MSESASSSTDITPDYTGMRSDIVALLETARRAAARSVNALMTASYWEIGRRIVEFEQAGQDRAAYGQALLKRLSVDLSGRLGRGFSERNLEQMRLFYLAWPPERISQTPSAKLAPPRDFAAVVCGFSLRPDIRNTDSDIRAAEHIGPGLPSTLVGLRSPAIRQEPLGTQLL